MSFRPPSPGVLVDNKYRLAERIGGGGMGDVYRAEHVITGRSAAIKFLHPELAQNSEIAQRFFQEAQAVNRIRHPNVVDVLDAGVGELGPYIVMEFLDGDSVGAALARSGRFEVDAAVGTSISVLEALDAVHRAGIIHRDLKPENIFIAFDASRGAAVVRLLDFGIAKMLDASGPSPRTRTGVVFGTPDYLSPEQATGEPSLDGRSDLFAVGVLLYELLTGTRPFRGPTAVATAFKVVHEKTPTIAAAGVQVDPKLEAIVQRLLQKEPAKRFPTAYDVVRELERVVPDAPRRAAALGRLINVARRMASIASGAHDADRSTSSRDPGARRRFEHEVGNVITLVAPRPLQGMAGARPLDPNGRFAMFEAGSGARLDPHHAPVDASRLRPGSLHEISPRTLRSPSEAEGGANRASGTGQKTPPRPFPERFAGLYQVRGPVLRSVDKVVAKVFGDSARDEIVAQMPPHYAAEFQNDSINALVAYDLEALDAYMEFATEAVVRDVMRWREFGRLGVDGELYNVVRTLLRPSTDLASVLRRSILIWSRLFSFGSWRVTELPDGKAALSIGDFEAVAQPLRFWMIGVAEQIARRAVRADVRAIITVGEQSFTPELTCELG